MVKPFMPKEFVEKYTQILGQESREFFEYCSIKIPKSIWVNSLKMKPELVAQELEKKGWNLAKLFHENAYAINNVERPGQSQEFREGLLNLQEKASMIPALVLDPQKKDLVLDATAAPGNKTLQLSCLMNGGGKIVAVEKNIARFKSLRFNVKKFGMKNVVAKRMDILDSTREGVFDRILLDAPCSSEGLVRKDPDALANWSMELVVGKAEVQKHLIAKCLSLLKRNGVMVYSTCSFAPEENEEIVQGVLDSGMAKLEPVEVKGFKIRNGLGRYNRKEYDTSMKYTGRIYPQDNDSQQFFVAKLRKK